jgi:hypothetical protein
MIYMADEASAAVAGSRVMGPLSARLSVPCLVEAIGEVVWDEEAVLAELGVVRTQDDVMNKTRARASSPAFMLNRRPTLP